MVKTLKELTEKRKKHIESCRENGDRSHELVSTFYSEKTHFIFEIIQNAEDTAATSIHFEISENNLTIKHNGREFNLYDIDSITTIGSSNKKDDSNQIGKFGVGFKSIFAVTDNPKIHSGQYHFEIQNYIVPIEIESIQLEKGMTKMIFPLKDDKIKEDISQKLQNLEMETLLFLQHIYEIKGTTQETTKYYRKENQDKNQFEEHKNYETVLLSEKNENKKQEYFIINDTFTIENKKLTISVAYSIKEKKIVKSEKSFLYVFFPTEIESGLNFLLQAPYRTTPNRVKIPFQEEENKKLTEVLTRLVADSLDIIKQEKLLTVNFLEILPIQKNDRNHIYMKFYDSVKEAIQQNEYILTNQKNSFDSVENLLLARGKDLTNLLDSQDLKKLWGKKNWITTELTRDKTRELREYLIKELNIQEITFETFIGDLTENFLKEKDDDWFIKLFKILPNRDSLYETFIEKLTEDFLSKRSVSWFVEFYNSLSDRYYKDSTYPYKEKPLFGKLIEKLTENFFSNRTYDWFLKFYDNLSKIQKNYDKEYLYEIFIKKLTVNFLKEKDNDWLIEFYGCLLNVNLSKEFLKNQEIIKLEDATFISLYDENHKIQVYKSSDEKSKFKTVQKIFFENENSRKFFEKHKVHEPDRIAELREFIALKYKEPSKVNSFDEYKTDIEKIFKTYQTTELEYKKKEIIDLFKDKSIIWFRYNKSKKNHLSKPENTYLPTEDLKLWFENTKEIYFVHEEIYNEERKDFFQKLGCIEKISIYNYRVNIDPTSEYLNLKDSLTQEEMAEAIQSYQSSSIKSRSTVDNYYWIDGLEENIVDKVLEKEKSFVLWNRLSDEFNLTNHNFDAMFKWFYYIPKSKKFPATFIKLLKDCKWIYDKGDNPIATKNLTFDEFLERKNDFYKNEHIEFLRRYFEFKIGKREYFEKENQDLKVVVKSEYEKEQKELEELREYKKQNEERKKRFREKQERSQIPSEKSIRYERQQNRTQIQEISRNKWEPEVYPDEIDYRKLKLKEYKPNIKSPDLPEQISNKNNRNQEDSRNNQIHSHSNEQSNKKIGRWGEKLVYQILKKKYSEKEGWTIGWLNQKNESGKGCDFVIRKNREEILYYIEVKSKTDEKVKQLLITANQWEWARKKGESYKIYVVSNAGKETAEVTIISNPVQKWKDGELRGNPIKLEL